MPVGTFRSAHRFSARSPSGLWMPNDSIPLGKLYRVRVQQLFGSALVAYWPMDETSGTTADNFEGTAARDGTYTGVTLADGTFNNGDGAPLFDGANDYLDVHSASINTAWTGGVAAEGSWFAWFKVSGSGVWTDSTARKIIRFRPTGATDDYYLEKHVDNNKFSFRRLAGGTNSAVNKTSITTTDWVNVVATWSESGDKFIAYWNGVQEGSTQTSIGAYSGNSLRTDVANIGATGQPGGVMDGHIAHVFIIDRVATAGEVLNVYNWGL